MDDAEGSAMGQNAPSSLQPRGRDKGVFGMTADFTPTAPRRGFIEWIALAREATGRGRPRRRTELGAAPVAFNHAGQLYERR